MDNFGILSLIPIVITIAMAITLRNISVALLLGSLTGILIMVGGNPVEAVGTFTTDYLMPNIASFTASDTLCLLLFISAFVKLLEVSGGAKAFAVSVSKLVNNRFKAQVCTWLAGFIIFFSDVGSPIIVGPIFQSLYDRLKISREKLAWIVDTTASPVSILIPFLGWGAYIMGCIGPELEGAGLDITPWDALIGAWPLQLYALLSILLVPFVAYSGKEFGAMYKAEMRARATGDALQPNTEINAAPSSTIVQEDVPGANPWLMIVPLIVVFATLLSLLVPLGFPFKSVPYDNLREGLITSFLFGSIANILLCVIFKVGNLKRSANAFVAGMQSVAEIFIVLLLAWTLSAVSKSMGAPEYVVMMAERTVPAWFLPALVFLASAIVSFSTGSSWGTIAIMSCIAIPASVSIGSPIFACIGATLSGALFGDHCSPISDTTVLSGTGAGCDLLAHVLTQLPYALMVGGTAFIGYIIVGLTGGSVIGLPIAAAILISVFTITSRKYGKHVSNELPETEKPEDSASAV